jgi:hypothetical protein
MKFGFRIPSITKRIAARTSIKRIVQNELGLKAPHGYGWITNPKKFVYNKVYNKTTVGSGCMLSLFVLIALHMGLIWIIFS